MIAGIVADLAAALAPVGVPVRAPLDNAAAVGPCVIVSPPTISIETPAGRCSVGSGSAAVEVLAGNGDDFAGLSALAWAAVEALTAAGVRVTEAAPSAFTLPDAANPVPSYTLAIEF